MGNTRGDFVKERLLGFAESGFREELKMLHRRWVSHEDILVEALNPISHYPCCLKDFAQAGEIIDA